MKKSIVSLAFVLLAKAAPAAEPQDLAFTATIDGTEQRYVEMLPEAFDPSANHDILIALHGHGSDRWQFARDPRGECRGARDTAAKFGHIYVSPDYRAKTSWMGPKAEADTVQLIGELKRRHRVGRVFIMGGSMGGTAALTFTALHPDLIAGVCSLNGTANLVDYANFQDAIAASFGGTKAEVPEEYRKRSAEFFSEKFTMPIAVTTGGKDTAVPPDSVLRLAEKLGKDGRRVRSIHREAGGHATSYADTCAALEYVLREAGAVPLAEIAAWRGEAGRLAAAGTDPDVAIFSKGVEWALRYDSAFPPKDLALVKQALDRGRQRADSLAAGHKPWTGKKGKVVRAFVSAVDGSIQPYGAIIPAAYDGKQAMRLDVVLHGSSKPVGMSELRFLSRFDEGDSEASGTAADAGFIEIHPLGRVENCYRWAGETDVFEAIEAACRHYRIDRDRIVLRGMSMGASGTWHLGLKHPHRFVAIGPYCGYVDTHRFSETPVPGFIKVGPLPPHQEAGLRLLDSVGYAANASVVPAIAAIGDRDVFFQSHVHMGEVFASEGLEMVNLISPGTGHVIDPATHREQMRRIGGFAEKGLDRDPARIRFVTWSLKYGRCHWLDILALEKHYDRAEFRAEVGEGDALEVAEARNITRFAIHRPISRMRVAGSDIALPAPPHGEALVFEKRDGVWRCAGPRSEVQLAGKRPGLQGPVDDAFSGPFLCVRGTGTPWHPAVDAWARASLRRFEYEWARYMRGALPVKDDTAVTRDDLREKHLILFGDPGSNSWIAKTLPQLPLKWGRDELSLDGRAEPAADRAPVIICANPLAPDRYLVLNSGHTFHESEFAAFNYLLFPRLGDWAVVKTAPVGDSDDWRPGVGDFPETPLRAGYFDEHWARALPVEP